MVVPNVTKSVSLFPCREQGNCRFCSRLLPPLESSLASALPAHVQQVAQQTVAYMAVVFQGQVRIEPAGQPPVSLRMASGTRFYSAHKLTSDKHAGEPHELLYGALVLAPRQSPCTRQECSEGPGLTRGCPTCRTVPPGVQDPRQTRHRGHGGVPRPRQVLVRLRVRRRGEQLRTTHASVSTSRC